MYTQTTDHIPLELIELFDVAYRDPLNRLPHNYDPETLSSEENLCYSVTFDDDGDAICGSIARARDFYQGSVRILSRYYVSKKIKTVGLRVSKYHKNGMNTFALDHVNQQVEFAEAHGYHAQFVSREYRNARVMRNIYKGINTHSNYNDWTLEKGLYQTAPCELKECFQFVMWRGFNKLQYVHI